MPIDYNIPLMSKAPQIQSPFEMMSQYATIQGQQGENQLTKRKLAAYDQADQQSNALAGLVKQNTDPTTGKLNFAPVKAGMMGLGMGKEALDMEASQADIELKQLEQKDKLYNHVGQVLGGYANLSPEQITPEIAAQYQNDVAQLHQVVGAKLDVPDQLDLPTLQVKFQQGMSAKDQNAARLDALRAQQSQFNADRTYKRGVEEFDQGQAQKAQTEGWYQAPGPDGLPVWKQGKQEGAPVYSPTGISNKPMPAGQVDVIRGAKNTLDAIKDYKGKFDKFETMDLVNPDKRIELSSAYKNVLLQAQQVYGLGVLNPNDEKVLAEVLTNPLELTGNIASKEAMKKQIDDVSRIIEGMGNTASQNYNVQAGGQAPMFGGEKQQPSAQAPIFIENPQTGESMQWNYEKNAWEPM